MYKCINCKYWELIPSIDYEIIEKHTQNIVNKCNWEYIYYYLN